jgi:3-oxoacyl-[acyl-carrier-protein] synthase III
VFQTYAGGPVSQVTSIIWPNPEFDNNITVYGPEVRDLAQRYIIQMTEELSQLRDPNDSSRSLLETIDLVIPHQANKTMGRGVARLVGLRCRHATRRAALPGSGSAWDADHDAHWGCRRDRPLPRRADLRRRSRRCGR